MKHNSFPRGHKINLGRKHTEETKKKMSEKSLGRKHDESAINKMKKAAKERIEKNGYMVSPEAILKMSRTLTGRNLTEEHKANIGNALKGENAPSWKGGITPQKVRIRKSREYRMWRKSVFERDNWTCVFCNERGGNLEADHIKPFAFYPELRFEIENGRTLCVPCHKKTPTHSSKKSQVAQVIMQANKRNRKALTANKPKFHVELERAIEECKAKIFEACGIMPDRLALPFNLYFKLVYSLDVPFKSIDLWPVEYCGLAVELHWVNSNEFRIFKAENVIDG